MQESQIQCNVNYPVHVAENTLGYFLPDEYRSMKQPTLFNSVPFTYREVLLQNVLSR